MSAARRSLAFRVGARPDVRHRERSILGAQDPYSGIDCECQLQTVLRGDLLGARIEWVFVIRHGDTKKTGTAWGGCSQTFAAERCTVRLGAKNVGLSPSVVAAGKFELCA